MLTSSRSKALLALAMTTALSACSVGPDYQRPTTKEPTQWSEASDGADIGVQADWWRGFGQPDLDQLILKARHDNDDLKAAVARIRQANAQVRIQASALYPSVSATGGAARQGSQTLTNGKPADFNNVYLLLGASYELDFWGKNDDARAAAQAGADASRFDHQTALLTLDANVANTYFAIQSYNDRIKVAERNLAAALDTLDAFRARFQVGTASALDIAQQESVVAEQRAALPPLTQALHQNQYALMTLTGALPETAAPSKNSLDRLTYPQVSAGLPSTLLNRRPDVRSAEAQLIAANANIKFAIASVFPSISLTAQGGVESAALSTLFSPAGTLFSLGAGLTQPIFKGGALEGGIELTEGRYEELAANYHKAVISAFQDVESSLAGVEQSAHQEEAQSAAVETARHAYEISQAQLRQGTVDIITVLNVERTLFQAEDLLVQAKLNHAQAIIGLYRALGGGWSA